MGKINTYKVTFNLKYTDNDGETSIIPIITLVHTAFPYLGDVANKIIEEDVLTFAKIQLEDVGVIINESLVESIIVELENN